MSGPPRAAALVGALALLAAAPPARAVFGDVDGNGSLGAEDVLLVQRALRNGARLTPARARAANVVEDYVGKPPVPRIDVRDLAVLLRRIGCLPAVCTGEIFAQGAGVQIGHCPYAPVVSDPRYGACMGPRVLVDSGHRPLHTLDNSLSGLAKLLLADGYDVRPVVWTKPFNGLPRTRLGDVLVIATPRPPLAGGATFDAASREGRTLADWVEAGGSLLLLADHDGFDDVASIVDRFGLNVLSGNFDVGVASRSQGNLKNGDPISAALTEGVERVDVGSGSAFRPKAAIPPGARLTPVVADDPALPPGAWMGVAVEFGAGRAYVSGDAGEFASQLVVTLSGGTVVGLPDPGHDNERFLRNILHWLDGSVDP